MPKNEELVKKDLQDFWKRLRKVIQVPIKYYAVGEYGEKFGRPHYHAITYGVGIEDKKIIYEEWNKGQIHAGTVTEKSLRYVIDYTQKKLYGDEARKEYGERLPPFSLMSKGLGLQYAMKNRQQLVDNLCIKINKKEVTIPRYYVKKLEINPLRMRIRAEKKKQEVYNRLSGDEQIDENTLFLLNRREVFQKNLEQLMRKNAYSCKRTLDKLNG